MIGYDRSFSLRFRLNHTIIIIMTKGSRFYYHNCIAVAVVSHNYHFEDMHKHITHCSLRLGGLELGDWVMLKFFLFWWPPTLLWT